MPAIAAAGVPLPRKHAAGGVAPRVAARAVQVVAVTLLHLLRFAVRAAPLAVRTGAARRQALRVLAGDSLAAMCAALGATFVKAGQILSCRPDIVSPQVARGLARLRDAMPPIPAKLLPGALHAALGRPAGEVFASFDPCPLACGSVASVHRARLPDGREVAVKLRRPGVELQVDADVRLLTAAAALLGRLPGMRAVPLAELVREVTGPVREQVDFRREARNAHRFRASFADVEGVAVPALVDELCGEAVLVMERVSGAHRIASPGVCAEERRRAVLAGLRALYRMIFRDGFVHADLHPGNLLVRPWGELVLLDFGLVAELGPRDRREFVDFFFGLVNGRGEECARIVWDGASYRVPRCDRAGFTEAMVRLVAEHSALRSRDFKVTRFVVQLMEVQRRFGVRGSTRFIMTILSMVVYDGICKEAYPECDFQGEARAYLLTARYGAAR